MPESQLISNLFSTPLATKTTPTKPIDTTQEEINDEAKRVLTERYNETISGGKSGGKRKYTPRKPRDDSSTAQTSVVNPQEEKETFEALGRLVLLGMEFFNNRIAKNPIPIEQLERDIITDSLPPVLRKYAPQAVESLPEITLAGGVLAFVIPRMMPHPKNEASDEVKTDTVSAEQIEAHAKVL